jgi:uncharacterized membrane protein YhiD involved in acid resistance
MAVAIGIGMLAGMEREWSNKDVGIRTFAIVALLGMLASLDRPIRRHCRAARRVSAGRRHEHAQHSPDRSLEITTSAALIVNYLLGVLVGLGHIFTPVAGAIIMTMLLAWKTELSRLPADCNPRRFAAPFCSASSASSFTRSAQSLRRSLAAVQPQRRLDQRHRHRRNRIR